jgi:uncharacterized damage-inducible protein DinB
MRSRAAKYGLMLLLVVLGGARVSSADCGYADALRLHWARTRKMLTAIVAAMPEDKWDFKPVKEVRSFREMVEHLVDDGYSHIGYSKGMTREESAKLTAKYKGLKTKADLLKALGESYDYGDKVLAEITDQNAMNMVSGMRGERQTRVEAALVAFEDQMDHYGNFVVYLRLNGIVPPDTMNADAERKANQQKGMPGMQMDEHQH